MGRKRQDVTDAELALLQVLWDSGPATIRQLTEAVYPGGGLPQYGTVQKLLDRLEDKEYVRRDRTPPAHLFTPLVGREELIGRKLQDVAEKLCGGSLTPLLTHLVQGQGLTAEQRQQLRDLIDGLEDEEDGQQPRKEKP